MRAISQVIVLAVAAGPITLACDDTARGVKQDAAEAENAVRESAGGSSTRVGRGGVVLDIDSQKVKEELRDAGAMLKKGAEAAADSVKEAVDEERAEHQYVTGAGGAH
jgi:hypothetical protein